MSNKGPDQGQGRLRVPQAGHAGRGAGVAHGDGHRRRPYPLFGPLDGGRIAVLHANVPNMISQISGAFAESGVNIANLTNKARGDHAYTMLDLDVSVTEDIINKLWDIEGVRRVRVIK